MISVMRRAVLLLACLSMAGVAHGWTPKNWHHGEMVENPRSYSDDNRFCFVGRMYDRLGDFDAKPAEIVFKWDEPETEPFEPPDQFQGALYDGNHLVAEFSIDWHYSQHVLIAGSGAFVVAPARHFDDGLIAAIFRADGMLVRELTAEVVLTPNDRASLVVREFRPKLSIRADEGRDILAILVPATSSESRHEEIRIDLATGALLDEKHDIYPVWRVWASGDFMKNALFRQLPEYPEVARKARIAGTAIVEVVVGESGAVLETRVVKPLPFGIDAAATAAAKQWLFMPGKPTIGQIEFHFGPVECDHWQEIIDAQ